MIKIGIMGAGGRMGRMLIEAVLDNNKVALSGAYVRQGSSLIGVDAGELIGVGQRGVALSVFDGSDDLDVLIDFSLPQALERTLHLCIKHNIAMVVGITGLGSRLEDLLYQAGQSVPIVYAGNYSVGVNLSLNVLQTIAKTLQNADIEIIETHHQHKLDAPSGTAMMMATAVADARGQNLAQVLCYGRSGNQKRQAGEIGIHAVRGGEVVGDHRVLFLANGESIELCHRASSRLTFATGAVSAAIWLCSQNPCLYDMQDVLGLK